MANACDRVIAIVDGSKWHRSALLTFVPADAVNAIVTDESAPADKVRAWRDRGVDVVIAEEDDGRSRARFARSTFGVSAGERRQRLVTTMAAVDIGAQSGRVVVGRLDGERLGDRGGAPLPERAGPAGGRLHWDILQLYEQVLDGI